MKQLAFLIALLCASCSTQPIAWHHPGPTPTPSPTPPPAATAAVIGSPWWLFPLMAAPIIAFAVQHYMATKDERK